VNEKPVQESTSDDILRPLMDKDLDAVVRMHMDEFGKDLSSMLGRSCLKSFFRQLLHSPGSACLALEREGRVIGYICGSASIHTMWTPGYILKMLGYVILGIVRNPPALVAFLRGIPVHRYYNQLQTEDQGNGFSFAVLREYRGEGLGKKLLVEWLRLMRKQGAGHVLLFTDAEEGVTSLYVKYGLTLVKSIKSLGRQYDFLWMDLSGVK
jgi:ribosomal protein S18 acetylase RimI-like enzyme